MQKFYAIWVRMDGEYFCLKRNLSWKKLSVFFQRKQKMYWAQFENINGAIFRFNTRIYLQPIEKPVSTDICIGAFIGKNPGSAQPTNPKISTLQRIQLGNDKLLPTIKNIMLKAYNVAKKEIITNSYIQVLNLFYLCDPLLSQAKRRIQGFLPDHPIDCSENNKFPFVFYSWGGPNDRINEYKNRFIKNIRTKNHIWFDYSANRTNLTKPSETDFVKHIQGLAHDNILQQIAAVI